MYRIKNIINYLFLFLYGLLITSCEIVPKGEMEIIPVEINSKTYVRSNQLLKRRDCFLIKNYIKNEATDAILDELICNKISSYIDSLDYFYYAGIFYKESWRVTMEKIEKDEDFLDIYGVNIYNYQWRRDNKNMVRRHISMGDASTKERITLHCDFEIR